MFSAVAKSKLRSCEICSNCSHKKLVDVREVKQIIAMLMIICSVLLVTFLLIYYLYNFLYAGKEVPFSIYFEDTLKPLETDKKVRNALLKKRFRPELVPSQADAVIIGSGMGGLTCAAILARAGKKVVVLEQHGRIGGCTHTYKSKGFEYDIGIHYVGNMELGSLNRCLVDNVTDGNLKWLPLNDHFDTIVIDKQGDPLKKFPVVKGREELRSTLKKQFPDDKAAIDKYFKLLSDARAASTVYVLLKVLPPIVWKVITKLGLHKVFLRNYEFVTQNSLKVVLDRLSDNEELKCVLSYSFGDYGCLPNRTPFLMHGMLINHFLRSGGFYPYGGASEIAFQMIPGIQKTGGDVFAGARVGSILFDNGKACGVKLAENTTFPGCEIRAPVVISDAGVYNTYQSLIPRHIQEKYDVMGNLDFIEPGFSCLQIMVGLNGTTQELGLESKNYWIYGSPNADADLQKYVSMPVEEAANSNIPLLFVSFPSAKDPSWNSRFPNKSTCVIVTFSKKEWFTQWQNDPVKKRGVVYENLKSTFVQQAWTQVLRVFPHLEDKVADIDGGTPISHQHYLNSPNGEIYGIDHSMERFQLANAPNLQAKTKVPGLYLCGQDVFTAGFIGSAFGGLFGASSVLGRNVILDLVKNVQNTRRKLKNTKS